MYFKKLIPLLLILPSLLLNSCITRQVRKDPGYKETFYGYFISKRGNDIVFIGKKYHYVFKDESSQISEFTKPEWKSKLTISEIKLRVDKDNNVNGYVYLQLLQPKNKLSKEQLELIKQQGFTENSKDIFNKKLSLKGIRYEPARGFDAKFKESFSRQYESRIFYDIGTSEKIGKAALTPVAYAADGVLILVGGIWIPLIIIAVTDENTPEKFIDKFKY